MGKRRERSTGGSAASRATAKKSPIGSSPTRVAPVRPGWEGEGGWEGAADVGADGAGRSTPRTRPAVLLALGALALLGVALGWREVTSPDLGFHLATARWILEHGWVPGTDMLTYTVGDHAYVDLQWLYQLVVHALLAAGGSVALVALTTAATLAFAGLLLARAARRDGALGTGALLLVLLFLLGNHWEPRPHLFSWLYGSLVLWILEEHGRGARRWLPALPAVMVLWVNTHSLFVLGLVAIATCAGSHVLLVLSGRAKRLDRGLLAWSAVAVGACLLNPYHVRGLLFPLVQLADIQGSSAYKDPLTGIAEFRPPFSLDGYRVGGRLVVLQPLLAMQLFAALAVLGLAGARRTVRLAEAILFAGFLYVFASAGKNFGYFALVAVPVAAGGLDRLAATATAWCRRMAGRAPGPPTAPGRAGAVAVSISALLLALLAGTGRLYALAWADHRPGATFNASFLPIEEARFLRDRGVEGRLLNTWNDGGWLAWATGLPVAVYSHGEVMTQEFYRRYVRAKTPDGFAAALDEWRPTVAVVPFRTADYWLFHLSQARDWRLVLANAHRAVFLHDSVAPGVPALPPPRAGVDYPGIPAVQLEPRVREAAARPPAGPAARLRGAAAFPTDATARAGFWAQTGQFDAAIGVALAALAETPHAVPDLLLILGHSLEAQGRHALADVCFDAFLRHDADSALAASIGQVRRMR